MQFRSAPPVGFVSSLRPSGFGRVRSCRERDIVRAGMRCAATGPVRVCAGREDGGRFRASWQALVDRSKSLPCHEPAAKSRVVLMGNHGLRVGRRTAKRPGRISADETSAEPLAVWGPAEFDVCPALVSAQGQAQSGSAPRTDLLRQVPPASASCHHTKIAEILTKSDGPSHVITILALVYLNLQQLSGLLEVRAPRNTLEVGGGHARPGRHRIICWMLASSHGLKLSIEDFYISTFIR